MSKTEKWIRANLNVVDDWKFDGTQFLLFVHNGLRYVFSTKRERTFILSHEASDFKYRGFSDDECLKAVKRVTIWSA